MSPTIQLLSEVEAGLRCMLPEEAFRQALINLVFNSVQALHQSIGTITVTACQSNGEIRVEVGDDGPGFQSALRTDGIRPFASFREDGTGLGLAIVKRFAHELGGALAISNRVPHGAVATISIPCDDRHAAADRG